MSRLLVSHPPLILGVLVMPSGVPDLAIFTSAVFGG